MAIDRNLHSVPQRLPKLVHTKAACDENLCLLLILNPILHLVQATEARRSCCHRGSIIRRSSNTGGKSYLWLQSLLTNSPKTCYIQSKERSAEKIFLFRIDLRIKTLVDTNQIFINISDIEKRGALQDIRNSLKWENQRHNFEKKKKSKLNIPSQDGRLSWTVVSRVGSVGYLALVSESPSSRFCSQNPRKLWR